MRKKNKQKRFLSVVVPAYKQEKTIYKDLERIEEVLRENIPNYEIICVIDGLLDNTLEEVKKLKSPNIKIYSYEANHGKGYAVRYGMARAKGNVIAFIDAGMDINPAGIPMLLEHMYWYDSDVIVGSIRHSASKVIGYPLKRKIYSIGYHLFTRFLFGLKITDSQRGLKIYKRAVLEKVLPRLVIKQFAFDIEILAVVRKLGFTKIHDGPVEMDATRFKYSSIKTSTIFNMFWDTIAVFYRINFLKYYNDNNAKNWIKDQELNFKKIKGK